MGSMNEYTVKEARLTTDLEKELVGELQTVLQRQKAAERVVKAVRAAGEEALVTEQIAAALAAFDAVYLDL
jgi:hypothetical protein